MSQGILSLAKQGNPRAIAALINHSTRPQGITVQVARQDDCLHVLFESARAPNQQDAVVLICNSMKILKVEPIQSVKVYGRQSGEKPVAWSQVIQVKPAFNPSSVDSSSADSSSADSHASDVPISTGSPVTQLETQSEFPPAAIESQSVDPTPLLEPPELPSAGTQPSELPEAIATPSEVTATPGQDWLRRPEAVVLILFVSMIMLWQLYIDLLEEAEADSLSGRELAERLGINQSTISRRKDRDDFSEWTRSLDPDGIGWVYQNQSFVPKLHADE
ncbi:hypothetical protein IQ268_11745 [Oculatella sp. LEGE 06141]|nr:hypothetical protein [Oculatella sp. LEGE 06141]MBE9179235.1 hypothetical protein [Oculatella sp. LEGE 06141]